MAHGRLRLTQVAEGRTASHSFSVENDLLPDPQPLSFWEGLLEQFQKPIIAVVIDVDQPVKDFFTFYKYGYIKVFTTNWMKPIVNIKFLTLLSSKRLRKPPICLGQLPSFEIGGGIFPASSWTKLWPKLQGAPSLVADRVGQWNAMEAPHQSIGDFIIRWECFLPIHRRCYTWLIPGSAIRVLCWRSVCLNVTRHWYS